MIAIYKKELQSYFYTPIGYVFIGVFLVLCGVFFGVGNLAEHSGNVLFLLRNMSYLWMLLCPILTMRLIAAERQSRSDALLYSSPCSMASIIAGKFFAACSVLLCAIVLSFAYPLLVAIYGRLYFTETLVGYLGFILMGCCFISLDLMVSCFAKNQVTAALLSFGVNLLVWFFDVLALAAKGTIAEKIFHFLSLYQRFTPFTLGQLSYANIVFGAVFIFLTLFFSVRILDSRRWSDI